ncbi:MAG: hypothetical protein AB7E59_00710 [Pusillimonas sp.]
MREQIDCAVLLSGADRQLWPQLAAGDYLNGRLVLHAAGHELTDQQFETGSYLRDQAMALRRFDACIVAVTVSSLSWCRRLLSAAQGATSTPVVAIVHDLKAAAINDLMTLGLADFVRSPVCYDEIRARINQLLMRGLSASYPADTASMRPVMRISEPAQRPLSGRNAQLSGVVAGPVVSGLSEQDICDTILQRTGLELDAYAVATAARSATSKESFRAAKGKVIERFERAYIAAALGRCSGNIAMAARAAQKHRRAFWALMRKYQIDASLYRIET